MFIKVGATVLTIIFTAFATAIATGTFESIRDRIFARPPSPLVVNIRPASVNHGSRVDVTGKNLDMISDVVLVSRGNEYSLALLPASNEIQLVVAIHDGIPFGIYDLILKTQSGDRIVPGKTLNVNSPVIILPTVTFTPIPIPTATPTDTPIPMATLTNTPTNIPALPNAPTNTPTHIPTPTDTPISLPTITPTPTIPIPPEPSATNTPTIAITPLPPDLSVSIISSSHLLFGNYEQFPLEVQILNNGEAIALGSGDNGIDGYNAELYLATTLGASPDILPSPSAQFKEFMQLEGGIIQSTLTIEGQGIQYYPLMVDFPRDISVGRYQLCARVDSNGAVQESDETNNAICNPIEYLPFSSVSVEFSDGATTREQIIVDVGTDVHALVSFNGEVEDKGRLRISIQEDHVGTFDSLKRTCINNEARISDSEPIAYTCAFNADEPTNVSSLRQWYAIVQWNDVVVFNPPDPDTRPNVRALQ